MSIFNPSVVKVGHKVVTSLVEANGRATVEQIAEALNAETGSTEWDGDVVRVAIEKGAFNTTKRAFGLFRGRAGGVRELDLEAMKEAEAKLQAAQARAAHAREVRAAKRAMTAESE
jgi:hypothetical protein